MDITVTVSDEDWRIFKEVAKDSVEQRWNGDYTLFAKFIMAINLETYIKANQKKREKKKERYTAEDPSDLSEQEMQRRYKELAETMAHDEK